MMLKLIATNRYVLIVLTLMMIIHAISQLVTIDQQAWMIYALENNEGALTDFATLINSHPEDHQTVSTTWMGASQAMRALHYQAHWFGYWGDLLLLLAGVITFAVLTVVGFLFHRQPIVDTKIERLMQTISAIAIAALFAVLVIAFWDQVSSMRGVTVGNTTFSSDGIARLDRVMGAPFSTRYNMLLFVAFLFPLVHQLNKMIRDEAETV